VYDYSEPEKRQCTHVTISSIHPNYGWILFKETEQLPQEVSKLLRCVHVAESQYEITCKECGDVIGHVEEAAVRGTDQTVDVIVCPVCNEEICPLSEYEWGLAEDSELEERRLKND
jgi:hypothetical protein